MADIFARLFDMEDGQVLVLKTETDDGDPAFEVRTDYRGVSYAVTFSGWTGDDAQDRAAKAFDLISQDGALTFRSKAVAAIDDMLSAVNA